MLKLILWGFIFYALYNTFIAPRLENNKDKVKTYPRNNPSNYTDVEDADFEEVDRKS